MWKKGAVSAFISLVIICLLLGCGGKKTPLSTWKNPSLAQIRRASEWGAKQDEDPSKWWAVCEDGPCQVPLEWRGGPKIHVMTPLALAAFTAYISSELDEEALSDIKDQFSNKLFIGLIFEGTVWDLETSYEAVITQGDLVIHPFQKNVTSRTDIWPDGLAITLECQFQIKDLNPNKPFWFSASQTVGDRKFLFKIDPQLLGPEKFF